jgi:hypothetical protein
MITGEKRTYPDRSYYSYKQIAESFEMFNAFIEPITSDAWQDMYGEPETLVKIAVKLGPEKPKKRKKFLTEREAYDVVGDSADHHVGGNRELFYKNDINSDTWLFAGFVKERYDDDDD